MSSLDEADRQQVVEEVGRRGMTAIYRPLLLGVIGELWVEYLTQMEALRVSIGLEAYAQRDPLVQYKGKAAELFQNLLRDMRQGVISRMFTYRPRTIPGTAIGLVGVSNLQIVGSENQEGLAGSDADEGAVVENESGVQDGEGSAAQESEDTRDDQVDTSGMSRSQKRRRHRR
jgi:preprotein translocase subunit SecA